MEDPVELVSNVFDKYPGSRVVEYLRNGACIQAVLDGRFFALEKQYGNISITEKKLDFPDLTVELNQAACEYLAGSEELEDFVTRARECINNQRPGCRMSYRINASPPRLVMKGYLEFGYRMGIL